MDMRFARRALPVVAMGVIALAGCHSGSAAAHASDKAKAQAVASSSQGQAAKQDAARAAERCQPKGMSTSSWEVALTMPGSSGHKTREAFYGCEHMTPAQRQAAGTCTLNAAESAHSASGPKAARETAFFTALSKCVPA